MFDFQIKDNCELLGKVVRVCQNRERPWRATGRQLQTDLDISTPAGASAAAAVVAAHIDMSRNIAVDFTAAGHTELGPLNRHPHGVRNDPELRKRISEYVLAYRMQNAVPELVDLSRERDI